MPNPPRGSRFRVVFLGPTKEGRASSFWPFPVEPSHRSPRTPFHSLPQQGPNLAATTDPLGRFPFWGKTRHLVGQSYSEVRRLIPFGLGDPTLPGVYKSTSPKILLSPKASGVQTSPPGFKRAGSAPRMRFRGDTGGFRAEPRALLKPDWLGHSSMARGGARAHADANAIPQSRRPHPPGPGTPG